jgi:hypothetical protein
VKREKLAKGESNDEEMREKEGRERERESRIM